MRSDALPPRRPPRSTLTSDPAQFALPFHVETESAGDQDRFAGEPSNSNTYSAKKSQPAELPTQASSSIRYIGGRKKRRKSARVPAASSLAPDAKLLVSRKVAAEMLSISVRGVDYMIAAKRLSTRRIAHRVLIPVDEIRRFARSDHPERLVG